MPILQLDRYVQIKKRNTELYMKMRQKHTHLGTGLAVRIISTGVLGYKIVFSVPVESHQGPFGLQRAIE